MPISKLADYRRKKGLSQEQLAAMSGVSARTIQRIEKGTVDAHGSTLKMLADTLGVDTALLLEQEPEEAVPATAVAKKAKTTAIFHILALVGLFLPVLNIILPAIWWMLKKDELPDYDREGRQVINFQLTMSLCFVPAVFLLIFYFPVGFPLVLLIYFFTVAMSLVNLLRSLNRQPVRYPFTFTFLR